MNQIQIDRIVSKPSVCGGRPCIAGSRIRVQDIYVWHELQGLSADQIVSNYPHLSMADVYAALAYYWDHQHEMQMQMQEESAFVEQMKAKYPSLLKEKLAGKDGPHNPLPS
jgi:uncharacterized protein (DUF433 family)